MRKSVAVLFAGALLSTAACGKMTEPFNDAEVNEENTGPADIINMPDGFSNIAAKCDGTTRVYTVFHSDSPYGSVAAVPDHPACSGR